MELEFYTTLGCHLCEDARALLMQVQSHRPALKVTEVEIADSDELMERYGVRIPVVRLLSLPHDLGWPFNFEELGDYLDGPRSLD